jgi:transposase-like protein
MPSERTAGRPTTRRFSAEEQAAAVGMVRSLQAEFGMQQGAVKRVAEQLGYGVGSVRSWVNQAEIDDGVRPGGAAVRRTASRSAERELLKCRDR